MDVANRIKVLRESLKLSQTAFGKPLGASRDAVNNVENGRAAASNMLITAICREYNVDEVWLRTGAGEMFRPRTREDDIAAFFGQVLGGRCTDFQRRMVSVLSRLSAAEWELREQKIKELAEDEKGAGN